jgi:triosephosphate isomerase
MRRKIVAGNWKMNKLHADAMSLAKELLNSSYQKDVKLVVIPPAIYGYEIVGVLGRSRISVGVQNSSQHESGAYTGELSASMIQSIGVEYVLVGHSERREYFNEQNDVLATKVDQLLINELTPVYCCGEVLEEREKENHFNIIKSQIEEGLFHLDAIQIQQCVIAYEPVWAIGTGVTASADQAQEMHQYIRELLAQKYGQEVAESISILYGGSCKPENASELFANPDVDGGLIGGASLKALDFIAIANSF